MKLALEQDISLVERCWSCRDPHRVPVIVKQDTTDCAVCHGKEWRLTELGLELQKALEILGVMRAEEK